MKKLALGLMIAASLAGCSTTSHEAPKGDKYLSEQPHEFTISKPDTTFDNGIITIRPLLNAHYENRRHSRLSDLRSKAKRLNLY